MPIAKIIERHLDIGHKSKKILATLVEKRTSTVAVTPVLIKTSVQQGANTWPPVKTAAPSSRVVQESGVDGDPSLRATAPVDSAEAVAPKR